MYTTYKKTMVRDKCSDFWVSLSGLWSMEKVANWLRRFGRAGKFSVTHTVINISKYDMDYDVKRFEIEVDAAYTSWQIGQKSLKILSEETVEE